MRIIDLKEDVKQTLKSYASVANLERKMSHIYDGQLFSHRQILSALYEIVGPTRKAVKVSQIGALVEEKYHLKSSLNIAKTAVRMTGEMYPLIEGSNAGETETLYIPELGKETIVAPRYATVRFTDLGLAYMKYLTYSDKEYNYNQSMKIPSTIRTLIPYMLLNSNFGLGVGINANRVPLNAKEILYTMIYLLAEENVTTQEIAQIFKGPDLNGPFTILMTTEGLKGLIEEGNCKFTVLSPFSIEHDNGHNYTLKIHKIPFGTTSESLNKQILEVDYATQLERLMKLNFTLPQAIQRLEQEDIHKSRFNSFTATGSRVIASKDLAIEISFILHPNYKVADVYQELLDKTQLKRVFVTELIGVVDKEDKTLSDIYYEVRDLEKQGEMTYEEKEKLIDTTKQKLDIVGIKDILNYHIQSGILSKKAEYTRELNSLKSKIWFAELLEKVTRPEVAEALSATTNKPMIEKRDMARDIAERLIPEGLTEEEITEIYKEDNNRILGKLHWHHKSKDSITRYLKIRDELLEKLKDENIRKELMKELEELAKLPMFERKSQVLYRKTKMFEQGEYFDIQPVINPLNTAEHPTPSTIFFNPISGVVSRSDGLNTLHPKPYNQLDYVMGKDIIFGVNRYSIDVIPYNEIPQIPMVFNSTYNGQPYQSFFAVTDSNDRILLVTTEGRAKIITASELDRSVSGFNLNKREYVFTMINLNHLHSTNPLRDYVLDIMLKGGKIRRIPLSAITYSDIKGGFKKIIRADEQLLDIVCVKKAKPVALINDSMNIQPYTVGENIIRDIDKVSVNMDIKNPTGFIEGYKHYYRGLYIPLQLLDLDKAVNENNYDIKTVYFWNENININPYLPKDQVGPMLEDIKSRIIRELFDVNPDYINRTVKENDYLLRLMRVHTVQTKAYRNYTNNNIYEQDQILEMEYRGSF